MKEYVKINLASPQKILKWTERSLPNRTLIGEINKSETVDYENLKPILGGLFCERIFGPTSNWECYCKKYKKIQFKTKKKEKILICSKCNVEIRDSKIRNYRLGHIKLASPIIHSWYLKNNPNYIGTLLNKSSKETQDISYNKSYIIIRSKTGENSITGGEAIRTLLKTLNLKYIAKKTSENLNKLEGNTIKNEEIDKYKKKIKLYRTRLKLVNHFIRTKSKPEWMTIRYLPILPPNIRPIVKLQDKTIVATDLNFIYSKIIESNNKLIKIRKMSVPEKFLNNEKNFLQETVDKLIDNNRKTTAKISKKPLKSLSKIIQGKKGRLRENLLGKTVDYSGRSVIIVEPTLNLNECGLPIEIALELFQPLVLKKMLELKIIKSLREGKKRIKQEKYITEELIRKITNKYPILLNRAPTLHRVGIQAFEPKIITGKAIKLHPLVCSAFNADFDGDQMGIHIPLTLKSQAEARILMISSNNCTSPATGKPIMVPTQDMVLGCYFLTIENTSIYYILENIKYFENERNAIEQYNVCQLNIHTYIWITLTNKKQKNRKIIQIKKFSKKISKKVFLRTTPGRLIFISAINEFL